MTDTERTLSVNGHTINVKHSVGGSSTVYYDGRIVAKGGGFFSKLDTFFTVSENGENVTYEIQEKTGMFSAHYTIKKNGIVIFQG